MQTVAVLEVPENSKLPNGFVKMTNVETTYSQYTEKIVRGEQKTGRNTKVFM